MGAHGATWKTGGMSFDQDPASPDQLVDPHKPTTKVNVAMVVAVVIFLLLGAAALVYFASTRD